MTIAMRLMMEVKKETTYMIIDMIIIIKMVINRIIMNTRLR